MTAQASARRGFALRVFFPDGDPAGIRVIEKSNWTGSGLVIPRSLFAKAKERGELTRAGVYLLVGESEAGPLPRAYIGEGDPVKPRLEQHGRSKDFWTHAVVFTSKDQNLNKAHVQRLESQLVALATAAKRCELDNGNVPQAPSLSESDVADVESFLDDVVLCCAALGYPFFERAATTAIVSAEMFVLRARGIEAKGQQTAEGFMVRAGSRAAKDETASCHAYLRDARAQLLAQGVLRDVGSGYELSQDYAFSSPSTAAGVLLGRSSNGRMEWTTTDGKTLKSVQEAQGGA